MTELLFASVAALWLGILTSVSPCPLATNIAAISFVSYRIANRSIVLLSGILYTIGRSITYTVLGFLIVRSLVNVPLLSDLLMRYMNMILGPLLVLVGIFLLGFIPLKVPGFSISEKFQKKIENAGPAGSLFLGVIFALALCPVSAAIFFGSLIPLAIKEESSIALPVMFGIGTGLPVLCFAVLVALGSRYIDKAYRSVAKIEKYAQAVTGIIFIGVGIYYVLSYIFGIL